LASADNEGHNETPSFQLLLSQLNMPPVVASITEAAGVPKRVTRKRPVESADPNGQSKWRGSLPVKYDNFDTSA